MLRPHLTFMLRGTDPDAAVLALLGTVSRPPVQPARELERLLQLVYPTATCLIAVGPSLEIHSGQDRWYGALEGEALLNLDACLQQLRHSCRARSRMTA